jgi:phosphatidate cytidylyltransferase
MLWVDYLGPHRWLPASVTGRLMGLADLLQDGLLMALVVAVIMAVALHEYSVMARRVGADIPSPYLIVCGVALFLLQWLGWAADPGKFLVCPVVLRSPEATATVVLCVATVVLLSWMVLNGQIEKGIGRVGAFAFGLTYIPVMLGFLGGLRAHWGVPGVVTVLAVCKFTDIGAYYAGTFIGGPRLAPRVSPRKTWAGAIGGTMAAVVMSLALSAIRLSPLSLPIAALYGVMLGPIAVLGDLTESLMKRQAGVKDSGNLLHGYGGVLDIIDDVLFAVPFSYLFFAVALAGAQA